MPEIPKETVLTEKQERFCVAYVLNHGNAAKAAREAGYSENADEQIGYENLIKPYIIARITEIRRSIGETGVVTKEWIAAKLKQNAERAMQEVAVMDSEGNEIGEFRYEGGVANKALELLGKSVGLFEPEPPKDQNDVSKIIKAMDEIQKATKNESEKPHLETANNDSTP